MLESDYTISLRGTHSHAPNIAELTIRQTIQNIKDQAKTTRNTNNEIISNTAIHLTDIQISQLPSVPLLKQSIRRTRKLHNNFPNEPRDRTQISIPLQQRLTLNSQTFLLHDDINSSGRIIIFASQWMINLLGQSDHWFCDGTFKTVPDIYTQLYTIHVKIQERVVPAIYALLPDKQFTTYNQLVSLLRIYNNRMNPKSILLDFEMGAIKAFSSNFPNAKITGCFFHLSQSIWRKVQKHPLILSKYKSDDEFMVFVKIFLGLCFLPPDDVFLGFIELTTSQYFITNFFTLLPLVEYFEQTYIGKFDPDGQWQESLYPIHLWNMYDRTLQNQTRSNNQVEGWHSGFTKIVNCSHPGFYKFIEFLKIDENHQRVVVEQLLSGHTISGQRKIYRDLNERLFNIIQTYSHDSKMNYLRRIAMNISI